MRLVKEGAWHDMKVQQFLTSEVRLLRVVVKMIDRANQILCELSS
jgi:hypothetical protein